MHCAHNIYWYIGAMYRKHGQVCLTHVLLLLLLLLILPLLLLLLMPETPSVTRVTDQYNMGSARFRS